MVVRCRLKNPVLGENGSKIAVEMRGGL